MKWSIIIPAYNAGKYLPELFSEIAKFSTLDKVVVINDGSSDNTIKVCEDNNIALVSHKKNKGKGAALRTGFEFCLEKGDDFVITMDADGQHSPEFIPDFIKKYEETRKDIIIGNRLADTSNMPRDRVFSNKTTTFLLSLISGQKLYDSQSGYRLISCKVLQNIDTISDKFDMESEQLVKASRAGYRIDQIPIKTIYDDEGSSSIHRFKDTYRFIKMFFRLILIR